MGGASVVAQLVRKPNAFGGWVIEIACPMRILAPQKAKDKPTRTKVVDSPRFNVVELDQLEAANSELARQRSEDA